MNIFILEDNKDRVRKFKREFIGHHVDHTETVGAGKKLIEENEYDIIFLDHDLGGEEFVDSFEEETGYRLAEFISINDKNKNTPCIVHSCNPAGADNIVSVLPHAIKLPFVNISSNIMEIINWYIQSMKG